jgi:hypothetical protein
VRRVFDVLLIAAVLGAGGYGAYRAGKAIIRTGNSYGSAASQNSPSASSATTVSQANTTGQTIVTHDNRHNLYLAAFIAGGVIGAMILLSMLGTFRQRRRRQHRLERWQV